MNAVDSNAGNPGWWTESHSSGWERVKAALRRDWEQTKTHFSSSGTDLNQTVGDTLRQAAGTEPIPPGELPNPESQEQRQDQRVDAPARWEDVESAVRYGYGARQEFRERPEWDEELEMRLQREWEDIEPGRVWHDVRQFVHRGWMGP